MSEDAFTSRCKWCTAELSEDEEFQLVYECVSCIVNQRAKLLAACQECLTAIDDCYEKTGHFKMAKTSEQRMKIEAALAKARGETP